VMSKAGQWLAACCGWRDRRVKNEER